MPSVDVDLDDIYWECSSKDKKTLVEWLQKDGFYPEPESIDFPIPQNSFDIEWEEIITKLALSRIQLTTEEEETIKTIYKKLV
jgi:hypothetical protein